MVTLEQEVNLLEVQNEEQVVIHNSLELEKELQSWVQKILVLMLSEKQD
jgi:hypothetical protein